MSLGSRIEHLNNDVVADRLGAKETPFWLSRFHADAPFLLRQPFHRGVPKVLAFR
jgi:hypothetical protein